MARTELLLLRVNPEEKQEIQKNMHIAGFSNISHYLRTMILSESNFIEKINFIYEAVKNGRGRV